MRDVTLTSICMRRMVWLPFLGVVAAADACGGRFGWLVRVLAFCTHVDALLCWLVPCLFCLSCKYTLRLATLTAYILPPLYTQNTLSLLDGASKWMLVLWGFDDCFCLLVNLAICRNSHQKIRSTIQLEHTLPRPPTPQHNKPLSLHSKPLSFSFPKHPTWITT